MATFEGVIEQRTSKAVLFWGHFWHAPLWLPTSQISVRPDGYGVVVTVRSWLAHKNRLVEFTEYTEADIEERSYKGG